MVFCSAFSSAFVQCFNRTNRDMLGAHEPQAASKNGMHLPHLNQTIQATGQVVKQTWKTAEPYPHHSDRQGVPGPRRCSWTWTFSRSHRFPPADHPRSVNAPVILPLSSRVNFDICQVDPGGAAITRHHDEMFPPQPYPGKEDVSPVRRPSSNPASRISLL